tara:strand:+ start:5535 stop:6215 length:681 start_codon:yes stop_codon:yes gene_type:complete
MARNVTVQQIIDRARIHADQRGSGFIRDAEALTLMNEIYPELYDELVGSYENYFMTTGTVTLVPGTTFYALPADFYKMLGVDFKVNADTYVTLYNFSESERNNTFVSGSSIPSGELRLRYIPAPVVFTALTDSFDGVAGWDRLLSLLLAIDMADAEETDSSPLYRKYQRTLQRIQSMAAPRDTGMPARVVDVYSRNLWSYYSSFRYRLQGDEVELISTETVGGSPF